MESIGTRRRPEPADDSLDIVSAYKSLKLAMNKNMKGLTRGRDHVTGKGYLRPTIISKQTERINLGLPPFTSQQTLDHSILQNRGRTAPTADGGVRKKLAS